ncbi:hypothetical protein C8035_v005769 [Colletotrichum spinosum]|uniref:Uncharacterized protein n=1 Tax=Colletotrichum spinosum TaxID=1347390 RepID=A0A4R8QIE6_9PEZI|nr:hypothetical protein C8035_v005769 [Colletotrichum spinosum]
MPPKRKAADWNVEESAIVETSVNDQMKATLTGRGNPAANDGTYPKILIHDIIKNHPLDGVATVKKGEESAIYFNGQFMVDDHLIVKTLYNFIVKIAKDPLINRCSLSAILRVLEYPHIIVGTMTRTKMEESDGYRFDTTHWEVISKASEARCKYTVALQLGGAIYTANLDGFCKLGSCQLAKTYVVPERDMKPGLFGWTDQEWKDFCNKHGENRELKPFATVIDA